ncbi:flagellar biosynthetic protein FliR [Buchnera aphidicola (Melanaphis sacchari)]|uniref:Flagellar biosynthetic protein FliR n=1 Tax=Buchnera aphidicola (Melanaphis sacchari) TaxID=2173854 RepID=A0A2U8DFU8_9GAMM|nr:flagellar biosynthetic protein FliR [Buchnera aphidicola]AWH90678.1 flagellar biosynthetic protein FliR [Buchnera aphidicola (Melanaphis sacchari)]
MLTFNNFQLLILIGNLFWPFVRILAFISTGPIFNHQHVNKKIKIILSAIISAIISPFLPHVDFNLFSFIGLLLLLQQVLIGVALGFVSQFLFSAINFSGEVVGLQMGLSFATFFSGNNYNIGSSVLSRILNILVLFLFLAVNAHLYLISALINSFYSIPISINYFNINIFSNLLKFSSSIFINSVMFVLPIMIFLLLSNLMMSFLNRLSPQISIFSIGFPLNLSIGILMLYYLTSNSISFFQGMFNELFLFISHTF